MLSRRSILGFVAAGAVALGLNSSATAAGIVGSTGLGNFGVTASAGSLNTPGITFTFATLAGIDQFATASRTGDYATGMALGDGFVTSVLDTANLGAFTFTGPTGTFQAQASGSFVVSSSSNFIDIYLLGTFTPGGSAGPGLAGKDPTLSSVRYSFNLSGGSVGGGGTLSSPPAVVPEPTSLALVGTALLAGLGLVARRRGA